MADGGTRPVRPTPTEPAPVSQQHSAAGLLGDLELAVLRALWDGAPASVRDVLDRVNARRDGSLAYTSVMTVLDRLHDKRLVTRERDGRAWAYEPVSADEDDLVSALGRREVDDLVARFGDVALVQFAARLDDLDDDARAALERLARRAG